MVEVADLNHMQEPNDVRWTAGVFTLDNTGYAWLRHRRFEDVSPVFTAVLGAVMREIRV